MPTNPNMPGASSLMDQASPAGQVGAETEDERKKRLARLQASKQLPVGMSSLAGGYGSAMSMT